MFAVLCAGLIGLSYPLVHQRGSMLPWAGRQWCRNLICSWKTIWLVRSIRLKSGAVQACLRLRLGRHSSSSLNHLTTSKMILFSNRFRKITRHLSRSGCIGPRGFAGSLGQPHLLPPCASNYRYTSWIKHASVTFWRVSPRSDPACSSGLLGTFAVFARPPFRFCHSRSYRRRSERFGSPPRAGTSCSSLWIRLISSRVHATLQDTYCRLDPSVRCSRLKRRLSTHQSCRAWVWELWDSCSTLSTASQSYTRSLGAGELHGRSAFTRHVSCSPNQCRYCIQFWPGGADSHASWRASGTAQLAPSLSAVKA